MLWDLRRQHAKSTVVATGELPCHTSLSLSLSPQQNGPFELERVAALAARLRSCDAQTFSQSLPQHIRDEGTTMSIAHSMYLYP